MDNLIEEKKNGHLKITLYDSESGISLSSEIELSDNDNFKSWRAYLVANLKVTMHLLKKIPLLNSKGNE